MEFVDGIDTDSCAYKYYNSLNHFRYQNSGQILLQNNLVVKAPLTEHNFMYQIDKLQISTSSPQIDFTNFDFAKILGRKSQAAETVGIGPNGATMKNNYIE